MAYKWHFKNLGNILQVVIPDHFDRVNKALSKVAYKWQFKNLGNILQVVIPDQFDEGNIGSLDSFYILQNLTKLQLLAIISKESR